jgi:AcrR family transcriptional regulator
MAKRKYQLKRRATQQRQTRERIVDATVALHQEYGPKATTISAVAERAGVQRLTVYRHFPTERDLFAACSSTYLARHPPPDLSAIEVRGATERTQAVVQALYAYYRETAEMWASVYRDKNSMPIVAEALEDFESYLEIIRADLQTEFAPYRSKRLRATLGHAVRFSTWQSLDAQGLGTRAMANLVTAWVAASLGRAKRE